MSIEHWRQTMAVNLDSCFYVTRAVLPYMNRAGGAIVNMCRWQGHGGGPGSGLPQQGGSLSDWGWQGAWPRGYTVNAITPGTIGHGSHPVSTPEVIKNTIATPYRAGRRRLRGSALYVLSWRLRNGDVAESTAARGLCDTRAILHLEDSIDDQP